MYMKDKEPKEISLPSIPKRKRNGEHIYKYFRLSDLESLLKKNKFQFSSFNLWAANDPYETVALNAEYVIDNKRTSFPLKDRVYGCCFTKQYSCQAQWSAYNHTKGEPIVQIEFNRDQLLKLISNAKDFTLFYGDVRYVPTRGYRNTVAKLLNTVRAKTAFFKESLPGKEMSSIVKPLFLKRIAYEYENEWRIVIVPNVVTNEKRYFVDISDIKSVIEKVIISPYKDEVNFPLSDLKRKLDEFGIPKKKIHASFLTNRRPKRIQIEL